MTNKPYDLGAILADLKQYKEKKRQPIADELATVIKDIKALEARRDELVAILAKIDGDEMPKPTPAKKLRQKKAGGTAAIPPDADIVAWIGTRTQPVSRSDIMDKFSIASGTKSQLVRMSQVLNKLVKTKQIKKHGKGRGTVYSA